MKAFKIYRYRGALYQQCGSSLRKIAHGATKTDDKGRRWYFNGPTHRWRLQAHYKTHGTGDRWMSQNFPGLMSSVVAAAQKWTDIQKQIEQGKDWKDVSIEDKEKWYQARNEVISLTHKNSAQFEQVRQRLLHSSKLPTKERLQKIEAIAIQKPLSSMDASQVRSSVAEFDRITGGAIFSGKVPVKKIDQLKSRSYSEAVENGSIRIGSVAHENVHLWHELGHFIEFNRPDIGNEMKEWVKHKNRETGGLLAYNSDYGATLYPGNFISPYVGRFYPGESCTEVVSVGLEHFADARSMCRLAIEAPDHFNLMIGLIQRLND